MVISLAAVVCAKESGGSAQNKSANVAAKKNGEREAMIEFYENSGIHIMGRFSAINAGTKTQIPAAQFSLEISENCAAGIEVCSYLTVSMHCALQLRQGVELVYIRCVVTIKRLSKSTTCALARMLRKVWVAITTTTSTPRENSYEKYSTCRRAACIVGGIASANVLPNGNFEQGNVGFTTPLNLNVGSGYAASEYTVASNPAAWHNAFTAFDDHTPGVGNNLMMIVNGSATPNEIVWQSAPIMLMAGTSYNFAAWTAAAYPDPTTLFASLVDSTGAAVSLGSASTTNVGGQWVAFTGASVYVAATSQTISLIIRNSTGAASGNDFVLDDISFTALPATNGVPVGAPLALMLLGLLGIKRLRR
jgi:hypothetical protein